MPSTSQRSIVADRRAYFEANFMTGPGRPKPVPLQDIELYSGILVRILEPSDVSTYPRIAKKAIF